MYNTPAATAGLVGNMALDCLPEATSRRLWPHLQEVNLHQHETLYDVGERVRYVYFPIEAVASGVLLMNDGTMVETCLIGQEGIIGVNGALCEYRSNNWMRVLLPGRAMRIRDDVLHLHFGSDETLRRLVLLYYQIRINHVSHRAVCNSRHRINERLATWLLMLDDRAGAGEIPLTQEMIARQMGVRRAGINECIGGMQRAGMIEHTRGHIRLSNRAMIERTACTCYKTFAAEMDWCRNQRLALSGPVGEATLTHGLRRPTFD